LALSANASEEVVQFLLENGVDDRAQKVLMEVDPAIQEAVIALGTLADSSNPSASLMARVRDVTRGGKKSGGGGGGAASVDAETLEAFLVENGIDEKGAEALRGCPGDIQAAVIERGSLADATNPSGAMMARIKVARQKASGVQQKRKANWGGAEGWEEKERDPDRAAKLVFVQVPPDFALCAQGYPDSAPAVVHDKKDPLFSSASFIIGELIEDFATDVELVHDEDWEQFPQLGEALKAAIGEESGFAVAVHSNSGKWGVGAAHGKKGRESSAKVSLAVAMLQDDSAKMNKLAKTYPDLAILLASQGLVKAPAQAWGKKPAAAGGWGAAAPRGGAMPQLSGPGLPVYWPQLQGKSGLIKQGYPADGPAVAFDKSCEAFSSASYVLHEMVGGKEDYNIEDDPDIQMFPDVAQACTRAGAEENCIAVAICPEHGVWAAGLGNGWKARQRAATLALAVSLAYVTGRGAELARKYPDFGQVLASSEAGTAPAGGNGGWGAPAKKKRGGAWGADMNDPSNWVM